MALSVYPHLVTEMQERGSEVDVHLQSATAFHLWHHVKCTCSGTQYSSVVGYHLSRHNQDKRLPPVPFNVRHRMPQVIDKCLPIIWSDGPVGIGYPISVGTCSAIPSCCPNVPACPAKFNPFQSVRLATFPNSNSRVTLKLGRSSLYGFFRGCQNTKFRAFGKDAFH